MATHLIRKLQNFVRLSAEETAALRALAETRARIVQPRADVVLEGESPSGVFLMLDGFACRYRMLDDGRRQIVGLFLPGDFCNAHVFILKRMDHSVAMLTRGRMAEIEQEAIVALSDAYPRISRAFWWNSLVEESAMREWLVSVGQRSAYERMAHLFCELFVRQRAVGLVDGGQCQMPLTQAELADALGISAVHVNRTLQTLRGRGLLSLRAGTLVVHDLPGLAEAAMFNPAYLHLDHDGESFDANAT
jgi:CRP-like cAMP-binding protein